MIINHVLTASLFVLAAGIFTSVTLLAGYQILIAVPALIYFYYFFKNKQIALTKSAWFLICFIIAALFSLVLNLDELKRPGKNFGQLKYLVLAVFAIFPLRFYLQKISNRTLGFLLNIFLLSVILAGGVSLFQYFIQDFPRAKGLTDTLRYGYGMGMILPVLLGLLLKPRLVPMMSRPLLVAAFIFGFLGLYFSFTRGAMLGLICALPCTFFFWKKKIGLAVFTLSSLIVTGLIAFYLFGEGEIGNRFISSKNNSSDSVRRSQWESAYLGWKESPIMGIGYSNYINKSSEIKTKYNLPHADYVGHAHNTFLEILVGTGAIGLFFFMAWFLSWMIEVFIQGPDVAGLIIPLGVSFFVAGQFEVVLDANNASMIFFLYALSMALLAPKNS